MLEILPELTSMAAMAALASFITTPPSVAPAETALAFWLAVAARVAFSCTALESCSTEADVSSIVAACRVVRSLRSLAPVRISLVAVLSERDVCCSPSTISSSRPSDWLNDRRTCSYWPVNWVSM